MSTVLPNQVLPNQVPATSSAPAGAAAPDPRLARIHKTAQQFEAIFIRQMLAAARKTSFGDGLTAAAGADSQGTNAFIEQQDAHFADLAAQRGSFGLGRMIEQQLRHQQGLDAPGAAQPAPAKLR